MVPPEIRAELALALDVDDLVEARAARPGAAAVVRRRQGGPRALQRRGPRRDRPRFADLGFDVFADLKLHDIPTTVNKAARVLGSLGASYLTAPRLRRRRHAARRRRGVPRRRLRRRAAGTVVLAVTVLTSDGDAPPHILPKRVATAVEAGCGGIVCAGTDVREARQYAPRLTVVVPGIRPAGAEHHDQARVVTPTEALEAGADLLVVGRAVTRAADPAAAAAALVAGLPSYRAAVASATGFRTLTGLLQ